MRANSRSLSTKSRKKGRIDVKELDRTVERSIDGRGAAVLRERV